MSQLAISLATILNTLVMKEVGTNRWECKPIPPMRVPARVITDQEGINALLEELRTQDWSSLRQLVNITTLPGIVGAALAMADVHPGYGFPIGGVAAFDTAAGVVSMAGVGFDINCGMRTLRTPLHRHNVAGKEEALLNALWRDIPAGLGSEGDVTLEASNLIRFSPAARRKWSVIERGSALAWLPKADERPFLLRCALTEAVHRRHQRKYVEGDIGAQRSFYFRGPIHTFNMPARNSSSFIQIADRVDDETWTFHLRRGDYSNWVAGTTGDMELATEIQTIEQEHSLDPRQSRKRIRHTIESRYSLPA